MTPETLDNLIKLLLIILSSLGVGGSGLALVRGSQREKKREEDTRTFKPLYLEATEKLVKQQERIDELELQRDKQAGDIVDIRARLTILNEERAHERQTFQTERDEYMRGQGRLQAQMEQMQRELDTLKRELHEAQAKNTELKAANDKLENYRDLAHELKRQHDDTKRLLDDAQAVIKRQEREANAFKDRIRFLESQLHPEPPPAAEVDPKASGE